MMASTSIATALCPFLQQHSLCSSSVSRLLMLQGGAKASPTTVRSNVSKFWNRQPAFARFFASGNVGNVVLFFCEKLASRIIQATAYSAGSWADTLSFFLAYWMHLPAQHLLHAALVYGLHTIDSPAKYRSTLAAFMTALTFTALLSTALNGVLLNVARLQKTNAFIATLGIMAGVNYMLTSLIMAKQKPSRPLKQRGGATEKLSALDCGPETDLLTSTTAELTSAGPTTPSNMSPFGLAFRPHSCNPNKLSKNR